MEEAHLSRQQENQWIDMARAGSLPAFNQLVLANQDAAFRIAKWMVKEDACAEDIVQTVFLDAYHQIRRFRSYHFQAWLLRMIYTACMDELRRRKRQMNARPAPEETRLVHDTWIEHCLRQLPDPMREVVILVDLEHLDYAEAAHTLKISPGAVKSRLGQARARMRDILLQSEVGVEGRHNQKIMP